jgi:hypothetical protein
MPYSRFALYDIRSILSILFKKHESYHGSKFILVDWIVLLLSSVFGSIAREVSDVLAWSFSRC